MEINSIHEKYMHRCIELASMALGNAAPNPMVGCVIVCNDKIIGEGYHVKAGLAHAEVNAINSVKDKSLLEKAQLYVNLEPCSHYGKTPPCSDLIIKYKIPEIFIGCIDPFSEVCGSGIKALENAGCKVNQGILEKESRFINRRFFTFHEKKRPYIILKWAQTNDGFIDIKREPGTPIQPTWITDDICKILVHKWRSEEDAFMAGTNTIVNDNPQLTTREWPGKSPLRVVIDRSLRIPANYHVFDQSVPTIIFTEKERESKENLEYCKLHFDNDILNKILFNLYLNNVQSVVVEGGASLLNNFISQGLWDEARVFTGDKYFFEGIAAPKIKGKIIENISVGNSKLIVFENES